VHGTTAVETRTRNPGFLPPPTARCPQLRIAIRSDERCAEVRPRASEVEPESDRRSPADGSGPRRGRSGSRRVDCECLVSIEFRILFRKVDHLPAHASTSADRGERVLRLHRAMSTRARRRLHATVSVLLDGHAARHRLVVDVRFAFRARMSRPGDSRPNARRVGGSDIRKRLAEALRTGRRNRRSPSLAAAERLRRQVNGVAEIPMCGRRLEANHPPAAAAAFAARVARARAPARSSLRRARTAIRGYPSPRPVW